MMFNATFNNISVISWRSIYWWRKPEYSEKTIDLSQVTDKVNNIYEQTKILKLYFSCGCWHIGFYCL